MRGRRGFTLVELLLVIVLVMIAAAIAMPRYASAIASYRAEAAAWRVAADLDLARVSARTDGSTVSVSYDVAAERYTMPGGPPLGPPDPGAVDLTRRPYRAEIVSASFGGDAIVSFDGFGVPDDGGTVVIAVGAHTRTVTLDADTGLSTVQ